MKEPEALACCVCLGVGTPQAYSDILKDMSVSVFLLFTLLHHPIKNCLKQHSTEEYLSVLFILNFCSDYSSLDTVLLNIVFSAVL